MGGTYDFSYHSINIILGYWRDRTLGTVNKVMHEVLGPNNSLEQFDYDLRFQ